MLTIEIPEVNARMSAEDELAQFILSELQNNNEAIIEYYHDGCAIGNWHDGKWRGDKTQHQSDCHVIREVAAMFRKKGYIVNDALQGGNISVLKISK